jgi:hypothetical protein
MAEPAPKEEIPQDTPDTPEKPPSETPSDAPKEEISAEEADWRKDYVTSRKGDEKLLKQLNRYASPEALIDAHLGMMGRINSGEFLPKYPEGGDEKEIAKWRSDMGIPEKSNGYELNLKNGVVPGENDEERIGSFLEYAHAANYTPDQVNQALNWYYDLQEAETQARHEEDEKITQGAEDQLRAEWGPDYRKNKTVIQSYLDLGPEGLKDKILSARLGDGTPLASDVDVLHFLIDRAREVIDSSVTLVPGEAAGQIQSIEDELRDLKSASAAPKGSKEYKKYWNEGGDKRYRELLERKQKLDGKK